MRRVRAALAGVLCGLALSPARVAASPSFARKYNVSCSNCHSAAYPDLNAFGRQFQENGYQFPAGSEPAYREKDSQSPGTIIERVGLLRELPLAARAVGFVEIPTDATASARNSVNLKLLQNLYLIGGGSLYKDISFFFSGSIAPVPMLHHATVGVHNLFGDGVLNLRVGELLLLDFLRPEHRSLNRIGNLGATTHVGLNPTMLDTSHMGAEIYGRLFKRQLFYQLSVVQGAQGIDQISDIDSYKDLFAQLQWTLRDRYTLGALGYWGQTQITDNTRLVKVRFTDPLWIAGGDVQLRFGPVMFFGYGLYGHHDNPRGTGAPVSYVGLRGDLTATLTRDLYGIVRFDGVISSDDKTLEKRVASANLTYLLLTNFKLSAEFDADLMTFNRSTVYVIFDVAM